MTTLLDTNVLIFALDPNSPHHAWAVEGLATRREQGPLLICDIVYSEFSVAIDSVQETDQAIGSLALERWPFSRECLFRAGKVFRQYKQNDGPKSNVLSDFLIGAQAETEAVALMTANAADYAGYFPNLTIISP